MQIQDFGRIVLCPDLGQDRRLASSVLTHSILSKSSRAMQVRAQAVLDDSSFSTLLDSLSLFVERKDAVLEQGEGF